MQDNYNFVSCYPKVCNDLNYLMLYNKLQLCCNVFRSTTEIAEGTSTDDEPVSKKIRTVEVDY